MATSSSLAYNIVVVPLVTGAMYLTFVLSLAMGTVLMSASTVIITLKAQLLKRSQAAQRGTDEDNEK